jgi:CHAT domain-containing protein/tetratricopeptide (TPR) repeat protein
MNQSRERMGGKRPFAQPVETALDVGRIGKLGFLDVKRRTARQPANRRAVGAEPQAEAVAGLDDIPNLLTQAVALGESLCEEAVHRVGGDGGGERLKLKIRPRRFRMFVERSQPAEQFQQGFARKLGRILGRVKRAQPAANDAIQHRLSAIGKQGLENAFGVVVRRGGGEITFEKFLGVHNIGRFFTIIMGPMRIAVVLMTACVACAGQDLASGLLAAKNAEERAALLQGHDPRELAAALDAVEKKAGASYAAKDYPAALNAFETAVLLARETGAPQKLAFYFRRLGLSHALLGQNDAALAAYSEGISAAEKTGDDDMLAENLHGEANILQRVGRYREALPFSEREYALTEKSGIPAPIMRAVSTYAQALTGLGRLKDALRLNERALELSRRTGDPAHYPLALGNLAMVYGELGDYETALRLLQSIPNPTPNALDAIAIGEVRLHREAEAEASYRAAIAASNAPGQWRVHAGSLFDLGILQHGRGKLADARAIEEQSLSQFLGHQDRAEAAYALAELSEIAAEEKKVAEAGEKAEEALRMARESENPECISNALVAKARALEVAGRDEEAGRTFLEAVAVVEGRRADAPASAAGLQGEVEQWMPTYQHAVGYEMRTGNALAALRLADRAKARVLLDMLGGGEPGFDALADPGERAEEQQVRTEVSRARQLAVTKPSTASHGALETALRKEDDFNVRLYARHPELVLQRAEPPELRPEDLAALAPDGRTALLTYFVLQDSVALFVVRAGKAPGTPAVSSFTLAGGDKLDMLIRSFRAQIAARDLDYRVSAKALFDALLAPAASALRGTDRWILSPDGALWDVPFQALMDAQGKHLLETHSLSYTPSLSVLRQLREKPAAPGSPRVSLLAVANPSVKGLAPIPDAEREANAIAAMYGAGRSTLLAGDRASASLFRESAGDAGVIHIASHAETETNHPLESFLLFAPDKRPGAKETDGALTARDLLGMRAELVVLSACETARGKIGQGDGVMGLGWAVLAAGARASVLSQWKVDSSATSDLMIDFHRRLTSGRAGAKKTDKADALRNASLDVMRSPGRLHPFYWAGFIVVGDAR